MSAELHSQKVGHVSHYHGSTYISTTNVYGTLNRVNHVESASFMGSNEGFVAPSSSQASPIQREAVPRLTHVHGPPFAHGFISPLHPIADASHTRNRRTSPPDSSCLPGTRKTVLERIMTWVEDPTFLDSEEGQEDGRSSAGTVDEERDPFCPPRIRQILSERAPAPRNSQHVLWLCGPVGCGKSAIAQTAAEELERQGRLAASFFFFRGSPVRNRMANFAITLANQMSALVPTTRVHVEEALKSPAGLQSIPVSTQIRKLVLQPLQNALLTPSRASVTDHDLQSQGPKPPKGKWKARIRQPFHYLRRRGSVLPSVQERASLALRGRPVIIVVDGVDECVDHEDVTDFIDHILNFFKQNPLFPLRFLINSRIEEHIREHIETDQVYVINLSDHAFDQDIESLVRHTFAVAAQRNRVIRSFGRQWPSEFYIGQLVAQAGGSFIFVKTMLNYILGLDASRDDGLTPIDRLKLALKRKTGLDPIYMESLQRVQHIRHASEVVLTIALLKDPVSINNLTHLLSIPAFKIVNVLVPLQAIVRIPGNDTETITLFHESLRDYILDPSRSTAFPSSFERDGQGVRLAHRCVELQVSHSLNQRGGQEDVVKYAAEAWLSLWSNHPIGRQWVRQDLDFLISLGRMVCSNYFDMVFFLFCQGVQEGWDSADRLHLWSFVEHYPGALRLWHSFPGFKPQLKIVVRALCSLASRDLDHLVIELPQPFGSLHDGAVDASFHICVVVHAMRYIVGDGGPRSNDDGPCMAYILLFWTQHLSLAVEATNSNADLVAFLQEKYSPRLRAESFTLPLVGIQPEADVLYRNLGRAISLINEKLPNLGINLMEIDEDPSNHIQICREDGLTILDMLIVICRLQPPYGHLGCTWDRKWVTVHIGRGNALEFYSCHWKPWSNSPSLLDGSGCGTDDDFDEGANHSKSEEVQGDVDRVEIGFRKYNVHHVTDGGRKCSGGPER